MCFGGDGTEADISLKGQMCVLQWHGGFKIFFRREKIRSRRIAETNLQTRERMTRGGKRKKRKLQQRGST